VGYQQAREPGAKAPPRRAAVGGVPEAVVEGLAGEAVAEQRRGGEAHHELGVLARRSGATVRARQLAAALVDERRDRAEAPARRVGIRQRAARQRAPGQQPRMARVAERIEDALQHVEHRVLALRRAQRIQQLGLERRRHVARQRHHQAVAAAEVMEDGRVRDAEVAGQILEAHGLRAALAQALLRRLEDGAAGFGSAAAGTGH